MLALALAASCAFSLADDARPYAIDVESLRSAERSAVAEASRRWISQTARHAAPAASPESAAPDPRGGAPAAWAAWRARFARSAPLSSWSSAAPEASRASQSRAGARLEDRAPRTPRAAWLVIRPRLVPTASTP